MKCLHCKLESMRVMDNAEVSEDFNGRTVTVQTTAWVCQVCGWVALGPGQLDHLIRKVKEQMSSNYPPGVTGSEPQVAGDGSWEAVYNMIDADSIKHELSDMDARVVWWLGLEAFKAVRKLGGKFAHD